jgi:hypothetical protein
VINLTVVTIDKYPAYKILSNILLSRLAPYIDVISGGHLYEFRCSKAATDEMFFITQIKSKKG